MTKIENNKRIAKNTLMLYIRMGMVMLITLYVSRIVLRVLGEEDYGIYNVVGGVVILFSFLSRTLSAASQRYFAFELGKGDMKKLNRIFNINLLLFCIVIGIMIILAETIGLWFLHNKMTIPEERMYAANWIYQFSILSFCTNLIAIPYQAVIIAREKMHFYAFVGIMQALLNLVSALLLLFIDFNSDKLILYGFFMLAVHAITNCGYVVVARKRFEETRFKLSWDREQVQDIISYSGWNLFGAIASVIRSHGINILINVFFNPVINAARSLSYQVNTALNQFASNFYTAVRPQVTKYYARGDRESTLSLVFSSSKYTFFLLLLFAVPVLTFPHDILDFWLVSIPEYTEKFVVLVVIVGLIDAINNPLITLAQATGKVKLYQSVVGGITLMNLPVSWFLLSRGGAPEVTVYVAIVIAVIVLAARLLVLRIIADFPIMEFCRKVLLRLFISTIISVVLSWVVKEYVCNGSGFINLALSIMLSMLVTMLSICYIGFNQYERNSLFHMLYSGIGFSMKR